MPQNTLEIVPSPSQETVVSIDRHREKKVSSKFNKPHCIVPIDDMRWVTSQSKIVQTLWHEAWASDQFGSRWMKLSTSLSDKSFTQARKILYQAGLFEFKRETATDDSRKTVGWMVINLHGARRIEEFWLAEDTTPEIDGQNLRCISQNDETNGEIIPNESENIPISSPNLRCISPETIENTGVSETLSNSSETSQELLKEVPEEVEVKTPCEVLGGLRRLGTKAGEKLAKMLEARFNLLDSKSEADYFREKFERQYRWRITPDRLEKLMELNNECRASFFATFKNLYEFGKLFGSKAFDKAMEGLKENAQEITKIVNQHQEYWDFILARREQMLGHT